MQEVACTAFRLVPKVVTLNDLERRNDSLRYLAEFGSFGANYVKVVEVRPIDLLSPSATAM